MWKKFNLRHLNWTKLGFKVQAKGWTKLKVQFKVQKNLLWTGPDWTVATLTFWPLNNCEWFTALLSFACDLAQTIFPFWFWAHFQNVVVWIWWLGACKYRAHDYLNLKMCFIWEVRMVKTACKIRAYVAADIKVLYSDNQILNFKGIHAELSEWWHFENEPKIRKQMWLCQVMSKRQ